MSESHELPQADDRPARVAMSAPDATPPADAAPAPGDARAAEEPPPTVDQVKLALRRVKDPELGLNIIDLGLVYEIVVEDRDVRVDMSLTSPACPSGPQLMGDAEKAVRNVPGVTNVTINLVWSPMWSPDRIEPRVRAYLGF